MFVDASAIVAILTFEAEKERFEIALRDADDILTSALSLYEATLGVSRKLDLDIKGAEAVMSEFIKASEIDIVAIDAAIGDLALDAFARFGKGRHRAALNMGDCFSYACAKARRAGLLCKGDDFIHTDIRLA